MVSHKSLQHKPAIISGFALLAMAIVAGYANFGVLEGGGSHQLAGVLFLIIAVLDVVVAYYLYRLFSAADKTLSFWTMIARLVYAAILMIASVLLLGGRVDEFHTIWNGGLLLFALHLFLLGVLLFRASFAPKWLSVLIIIAGLGYAIDSIGKLVSASYSLDIAGYTFIGEVVLIFWLLWVGFRKRKPAANP